MASLTPIPVVSTGSCATPCPERAATDASSIPGRTVAESVAVSRGETTGCPLPVGDVAAETGGVEPAELAKKPPLAPPLDLGAGDVLVLRD